MKPRLIALAASTIPLLVGGLAHAGPSSDLCPPGTQLYGATVGGFCCQGTVNSATDSCTGHICALDPSRPQGNPICPPPNACEGRGQMYGIAVGGFCCDGVVDVAHDTCGPKAGTTASPHICAVDPTHAAGFPICCAPGLAEYGWEYKGYCCDGTVASNQTCSGAACKMDPSQPVNIPVCPAAKACFGNGQMYGVGVGGFCCDGVVDFAHETCSDAKGICALSSAAQGYRRCGPPVWPPSTPAVHAASPAACPKDSHKVSDGTCRRDCPAGSTRTAACTCQWGSVVTDCGAYNQTTNAVPVCTNGGEYWGGLCYRDPCPSGTHRTASCTCQNNSTGLPTTECWNYDKDGFNTPPPSWQCPAGSTGWGGTCYTASCPAGMHRTAACSCQSNDLSTATDCSRWSEDEVVQPCVPSVEMSSSSLDVTFLVETDVHFFRSGFSDRTNQQNVLVTNRMPSQHWPIGMTSGGLPIGDPIGVVLSGDLSNDGDQYQLDIFREYWEPGRKRSDLPQAEQDRTEVSGFAQPIEQMKFAYWLGFGNHDAAQSPDASGRDRWVNFTKSRLGYQCANKASYEDNYGSYSWDWGNLHLVQLNTLGFFVNGGDHHYEVDAWLKQDLLDHASDGRPVILFQHYAFTGKDSLDFWPAAYHEDYLNAIKGYNVIAIFAGHDHEPAIDTSTGYTLYRGSTGGDHSNFTPSGVFAVHVTNDYLDVAFYEWCSHGTPTKCEAGKSCAVARCASADVDPAPAVPPVQYNPVYSQHRYIGR